MPHEEGCHFLPLRARLKTAPRRGVELILTGAGLLLLEPEFSGSPETWNSLLSPNSRILVPNGTPLPEGAPRVDKVDDPETTAKTADLVLRF
jgi:hypothetical protein